VSEIREQRPGGLEAGKLGSKNRELRAENGPEASLSSLLASRLSSLDP